MLELSDLQDPTGFCKWEPSRVLEAFEEDRQAVLALDTEHGLLSMISPWFFTGYLSHSWTTSYSSAIGLLVAHGAKLTNILRKLTDYYYSISPVAEGCKRTPTPLLECLVTAVAKASRGEEFLKLFTIFEFEGVLRLSDAPTLRKFRVLGLGAGAFPELMQELEERALRCDELGLVANSRLVRAALARLRSWQRCDEAAAQFLAGTLAPRLPAPASMAVSAFAIGPAPLRCLS